MNVDETTLSSLLNDLPAIFRRQDPPDTEEGGPLFLGRLLLAFEHVLLGLGDSHLPGLEETIAGLDRYFNPDATPSARDQDFLAWLAGWVALTLREDWEPLRQRDLIKKAVSLYRLRGTLRGVEEFMRVYVGVDSGEQNVRIDEFNTPFQIGVHSRVGVDSLVGEGAPYFFHAHVRLSQVDPARMADQKVTAAAIIDLQKPAHTYYQITVDVPTFQVGVHSTVGLDSLVG